MSGSEMRNDIIARNSILNFAGQLIPLIIGVASIPYVIKGLGVDGFGILSLAWMILGYFTFFDLGLGRATTKFIAEELHSGATGGLHSIFWTSSTINLCFGVLGGGVLVFLASVLAQNVFQVPQGLTQLAESAFILLGISLPIVLISMAFRGTLEAAQRFDFVNIVNVVSSSFTFLMPLIGVLVGLDVLGIVFLLMMSRLAAAIAYLLFCFKVFPILRNFIAFDPKLIRRLLSYGGWVSISNIINPILGYLDRFMIGSMISLAAVAYYTAPYEMVMRSSILPTSLTMALFPSFSSVGDSMRNSLMGLYFRSVKFLLLLMMPLVTVLILFANEIVYLWLGPEFAQMAAVVFRILAIGVLLNSLAQIPYALIQGFGYPNITAKFHLFELLLYVPLVWFLVKHLGIVGGAVAWTIRVAVDSMLLFGASGRFMMLRPFLEKDFKRAIVLIVFFIFPLFSVLLFDADIVFKIWTTATALIVFTIMSWYFVLNATERDFVSSSTRLFMTMAGRAR